MEIRFLPLEFVPLGVNRPLLCHNYATLYYRRVIHTLVINMCDVLNVSMGKTVDTDEKAALFTVKIPLRMLRSVAESQHLSKATVTSQILMPVYYVETTRPFISPPYLM